MPDIRVENVTFTYPGASSPALQNVKLQIPEGEFVLLAGPSGCGKSTLALALTGLIPARIAGRLRGKVYFGEKETRTLDIHEIAQSIGMVFQNPDEQLIHLNVEAEVAFGPENLALPRSEIARRVDETLAYTGMESFRMSELFALSGGQKQRVAIAATLAMRSRVLVLDEPTSDLDPVGTQEVLSVLRRLNREQRMTIVLVEHKIDEVIPWVDRVILMDQGKIVMDAAPRKAFVEQERWQKLGVAVPQMVQIAHALPDIFQQQVPLSVDEVYEALNTTPYRQALLQHNAPLSEPLSTKNISPVLEWEQVSLAYDKKQVLRAINLQVQPEEWLAIVGANGSGKTSLASLAMGFQAPSSGRILHHDKVVEAGQISRQAEKIAYLFQAADNMLFASTVEQELLFGVKYQKKQKQRQIERRFTLEELLAIVDLLADRQRNPFHLSHGQRKRLALGALLTRYPEVLILDEPTTGQDEGHARAFLNFLQQLREQNKFTYLMITHNMEAVARYASRVVVLKDGQILLDGPPEQVFARTEELAMASVLPVPVAQLHARLCAGQAQQVALNVESFLRLLQPLEALP